LPTFPETNQPALRPADFREPLLTPASALAGCVLSVALIVARAPARHRIETP
jgi:hypothetical protein